MLFQTFDRLWPIHQMLQRLIMLIAHCDQVLKLTSDLLNFVSAYIMLQISHSR